MNTGSIHMSVTIKVTGWYMQPLAVDVLLSFITKIFIDRLDGHNDDVYLEYYSGKGFHINYSVYMSYVKHMNSSNKTVIGRTIK